nr:immunoglobulin light chain junction region [Macaca mulatta]MPN92155.1 immunoglobulin light chain junction region [Macaca mulatta]MPN92274.1 immunoglobulin light chain junction region [Macaca mulatta]MPN92776.1 immunoglobulin light chain junction region [Macaca mulatta]MPN93093.1 immunoglobulin light chain junction region [Macaca mulatta]
CQQHGNWAQLTF